MVRGKRVFHCQRCDNPCTIYKKGKKHRVLVCPECGIIATNPLPLLALAAGARLAKPLISKVAGSFLGGNAPPATSSKAATSTKQITDSLDKPNKPERYVDLALRG